MSLAAGCVVCHHVSPTKRIGKLPSRRSWSRGDRGRMPTANKVYLVGAGPGHPGLLTLRAVECLRQADLVLYDKLVSPILLEHVPAAAETVCVTELAAHHDERVLPIHDVMVSAARAGRRVVRLKRG